jgi:hypothetical protein
VGGPRLYVLSALRVNLPEGVAQIFNFLICCIAEFHSAMPSVRLQATSFLESLRYNLP